MTEIDSKSRAIADALGALLKVAGDQSISLSNVGLVMRVSADTCKGTFLAEIGHVIYEETKPVEAPKVAEAEETSGESDSLKVEKPVSMASLGSQSFHESLIKVRSLGLVV